MKNYIKPETEAFEIDIEDVLINTSESDADPDSPVKTRRYDAVGSSDGYDDEDDL